MVSPEVWVVGGSKKAHCMKAAQHSPSSHAREQIALHNQTSQTGTFAVHSPGLITLSQKFYENKFVTYRLPEADSSLRN